MTQQLSRRSWLKRSAMAAAILPVSNWYLPHIQESALPRFNGDVPIRLNSNENAYGPSEAARKAIMESLNDANRYPRNYTRKLKEEIALREGLTPDHVMLTAGSTELLGLAGLVYGLEKGDLVACSPTFDFLMLYAERMGCDWGRTPLTQDFQQDLKGLAKACGPNTRLIFICNPNNPTGVELPAEELMDFCESQSRKYPIYVDEAYVELSPNGRKSSMAPLTLNNQNIIVGRTFSKVHGLAGMRIGYALANPMTIERMANLHTGRELTVSCAGAAAALACLNDPEFEAFSRAKIIEGRELVCRAFDQMGVEYLPSATNFVLFRNEKFKIDPVEAMEQENILIRKYEHLYGWTRVSIGTVEEMEKFTAAAKKYVNA
jgi:histidinol-phosphate aminotransferase